MSMLRIEKIETFRKVQIILLQGSWLEMQKHSINNT